MRSFYPSRLLILLVISLGFFTGVNAQTVTNYSYTGAGQTYTVPAGCTLISFDVIGAKGGGSNYGNGGAGGRVQGMMNVTPGQVLNVYVGNVGAGVGGPGGGNGSGYFGGIGSTYGGAGGGCSEIQIAGTRVVVAGAGGGGSWSCTSDHGGLGGGLTGTNGLYCGSYNTTYCGTGGSQVAGGIPGSGAAASAGTFGNGGNGFGSPNWFSGGGAGYYGGGGGAGYGSGGGGSSYPASTNGTIVALTHTQGYNNSGNGSIGIQAIIPTLVPSTSLLSFGALVTGTSAISSFTISGVALTTSLLTLAIPADFSISTVSAAGPWISGSATIPFTPPTLASTTVWVKFAPTAYSVYSNNITITGGGVVTPVLVNVTGQGLFPCNGVPASGTASCSPASGGTGTAFTLTNAGGTTGGLTYQWQSWTFGAAGFTNFGVSSASPTLNFTGITTNTYFRCVVTCTFSGLSSTTSPILVTLTPAPSPCSGIPTAGTVTATSTVGCAPSYSSDLYNVAPARGVDIRYNWQVSTTSATAGFTNIAGATTPYFTQSVSGSTIWVRDSISCVTASTSSKTPAVQLVLNPQPSPIGGFTNVCNPSPVAYTSSPAGGTWTSSNTTYLGINPSTGIAIATGAAGPTTVSYTLGTGCSASTNVNVYNGPMAITGATSVCPDATTALSNVMWGGVWSSTNSSVATIGTNGVVTGVAPGTINISYTLAAGCSTFMPMAVYPLPAPITGTASVCAGGSTTVLSSLTSGGVWTSNNTVQATAGATSGIITGGVAGSPIIKYTLPTGCYVSMPVTVNPLPAPIAGTPSVCLGSTTTLTNVGGGTWSSNDIYTASINSATGVINGIAAGDAMISYFLPVTGCFVTQPFKVNPLPVVNTVTGGGGYCPASTGVHIGLNGSQNGVNYSLYSTSSMVATRPGSTSSIDFGLFTGVGNYTVIASNSFTGCRNTMAGSATVYVNTLPHAYLLSGGGAYCSGGIGVHVVTNGSEVGTSYQLYVDGSAIGFPIIGDGNNIDFGLQTAPGHYTAIATNVSTLCNNNLAGGADVIINATPIAYNVMGGGNYCLGGAGRDISLDNSEAGFEYKLFNGTTLISTLSGIAGSLDFGNQTLSGNYTITGRNLTTGCLLTMSGSANVNIDPLPTGYNLSGGGNYCAGGTGTHIGMDYTVVGTNYQLMMTGGSGLTTVAGTNAGIDFGMFTAAGNYSVLATIAATGCTAIMPNTVNVGINSLPIIQTISGGGSYCNGGTGVEITLGGSESGKTYQLYLGGSPVGTTVNGTGGRISFGMQTAPGVYTARAYNPSTACMRYMSGSVTVTVNDNPTVYNVTGGGNYCAGTGGAAIMLSGSQSGINYQTVNSAGIITGMVAGTATSGSFNLGNQTAASVYSVKAVNLGTGCTSMMNGSVPVAILPLPAQYTVTGGGTICSGDAGIPISLLNSNPGYNYQLQLNGINTGAALLGTGTTIDFGTQTGNGTYAIIGTNNTTGCSTSMANTVAMTVNALPQVFTVTGGGSFCAGSSGADVRLSGSNTSGVTYQLWNGTTLVSTMSATGAAIDFGYQTVTGNYTVKAISSHGCVNMMASSAAVTANPLPVVYTVTGGGSYCEGGTGVHIGLSGSQIFVNYQVSGGSGVAGSFWAGTGSALDLGSYTASGTFYVRATDTLTHCSSNMSGSTSITVNPSVLPSVAITTGAGSTVCEGAIANYTATAVNGGVSPNYEWVVNGSSVGYGATFSYAPSNLDIVKVILTSDALCASPAVVTRNLTMTVNPNETPTIVVSANTGATVCPGTSVTYSAATTFGGSTPGYSWKINGVGVSGAPTYTYVPAQGDAVSCALTSNFTCRTETFVLSNSVVMAIDAPIVPEFTISGANATITSGHSATLSANLTNAAPNATYQWSVNGVAVAGETGATFTSDKLVNGDNVCCTIVSHNDCGSSNGVTVCASVRVANVGVAQVASINDLSIVPNPNKGIFNVKGSLGSSVDANVTLEITNMLGQVVYSNKVIAAGGSINEQVQLSNSVAPGMYLLNVRSGSETSVFHFVVE